MTRRARWRARQRCRAAAPGPHGFVFVGVKGGQLRRGNFSKPWARALAKAGLPDDLHVHDLRHTGNTLAEAGASLGELMNRMGHWSTRAARIYLHSREEREQQLASTLDKMARRELKAAGAKRTARRSGTQRARDVQSGVSGSEAGQHE
jgi:integrase